MVLEEPLACASWRPKATALLGRVAVIFEGVSQFHKLLILGLKNYPVAHRHKGLSQEDAE